MYDKYVKEIMPLLIKDLAWQNYDSIILYIWSLKGIGLPTLINKKEGGNALFKLGNTNVGIYDTEGYIITGDIPIIENCEKIKLLKQKTNPSYYDPLSKSIHIRAHSWNDFLGKLAIVKMG